MTYLHYLILDLFYDETISEHHITHPEFDLAFNVESYNSTPEQRMEVVKYFLNNKILELSKYGSFQLTKNGGKYWEKLFCPNWDLYFEFYSICDENYLSTTCFCATKLEIVQRFINLSNGLLDGFQIKKQKIGNLFTGNHSLMDFVLKLKAVMNIWCNLPINCLILKKRYKI